MATVAIVPGLLLGIGVGAPGPGGAPWLVAGFLLLVARPPGWCRRRRCVRSA